MQGGHQRHQVLWDHPQHIFWPLLSCVLISASMRSSRYSILGSSSQKCAPIRITSQISDSSYLLWERRLPWSLFFSVIVSLPLRLVGSIRNVRGAFFELGLHTHNVQKISVILDDRRTYFETIVRWWIISVVCLTHWISPVHLHFTSNSLRGELMSFHICLQNCNLYCHAGVLSTIFGVSKPTELTRGLCLLFI